LLVETVSLGLKVLIYFEAGWIEIIGSTSIGALVFEAAAAMNSDDGADVWSLELTAFLGGWTSLNLAICM
jgi:hypothetical protein|tara:strand:+ start:145 stop:354 length:210 start_codon:yes stop_codon:yes gene_type:complete